MANRRSIAIPFLVAITGVLGYAVFRSGGVVRPDRYVYLLALGLLTLVHSLCVSTAGRAPALDRRLSWPVLLLFCYVAFQLLPLPLSWMRVISPARAELLEALAPVVPGIHSAPLSVDPAGTLTHLLLVAGYTVLFYLVREITWHSRDRLWLPAFPLVLIAALEGALGLVQYAGGDPENAHGTYAKRNHYVALLEMALPFAVMYAIAILRRDPRRSRSSAGPAMKACLGLAGAALILLGVIYSLSRMGFLASLLSLFVIGALTVGWGLASRHKWLALASVAIVMLLSVVFLPPAQLIQRFGRLASEDRLQVWGETLHLVSAYPVFGCGLGAYESAFPRYKVSAPLEAWDHAHNDYLQLLAELGLAGSLIAAALLLVVLSRLIRVLTNHPEPDARYLAIACTGALAGFLAHSITDFNLYIPANAMVLAWILGLSVGLDFSPSLRSERPG